MLTKKIIILSGSLGGVVKLENLNNKGSGSICLNCLEKECKMLISVGENPLMVVPVRVAKTTFLLDISHIEGNTHCILIDDDRCILAEGCNCGVCDTPTLLLAYYEKIAIECHKDNEREKSRNHTVVDSGAGAVSRSGVRVASDNPAKEKHTEIVESSIVEVAKSALGNKMTQDKRQERVASVAVDEALAREIGGMMMAGERADIDSFYDKVKDRLEELFAKNKHDEDLERVVHNSRWVRVEYDDNNYYVVGVIIEDSIPLFICYGVPVDNKNITIQEGKTMCEWLPIDMSDVSGSGYWVIYQDAKTGETLT